MPDYCKCIEIECVERHGCGRYLMKPGCRQSFFMGSPRNSDGTCDYYLPSSKVPFACSLPSVADEKNKIWYDKDKGNTPT